MSNGGGLHPLWSPDGRRAFYRSGRQFFEVDVTTIAGRASLQSL